ncbi:MAG: hypothetical protein JKY66_05795 [Spongiibacteraceae bacterium]|nr:hypothetical protein [Spongiibacteraceae bacterium]
MFNRYSAVFIVIFSIMSWHLPAAPTLADPTRPAHYHSKKSKAPLKLESILFSNTRKVAVINGSLVTEGDRIEDSTVLKINKDRVRLKRNGKITELVLHRTTIRQEN